VRMPHYSYVADLTSLVRFHSVLLKKGRFRAFISKCGRELPKAGDGWRWRRESARAS
jgi:hypothetical protein